MVGIITTIVQYVIAQDITIIWVVTHKHTDRALLVSVFCNCLWHIIKS